MKNKQEKRLMANCRASALALAAFFGASLSAMAQNAIQSINSSQQAGADVVRIELSEALTEVPKGFSIQTPPRVAIDLPGVSSALGKPSVELNQGNLRSVSVAQGSDRTRLVLNLKQASNYRAELQGKVLLLVLESSAQAASASSPSAPAATEPVRFAENLNTSQVGLQGIDFRRGTEGAGRVVVNLPNNQVGVDIRQQGQSLVVEFLKSSVPENLRRRLDVTDFGTPVQTVTTTQTGDKVRMVVEPRGAWEHSAYQTDNQFVLEVRPQKIDPNKLTQGPGYAGEKLSLNFQNIEVRALLQVIADFTNFNVVTSDSVTGSVTLRLKDVPWDQALDIIMQARGLGQRKTGNVILIAPKDELAAKETAELEAKAKITSLEPLRTQAFQLNYGKAEEIRKSLTGEGTTQATGGAGGASGVPSRGLLSNRGSVLAEARTNQLFITDTPAKLEEIQSMITRIDIPVRQVLIEARIVEASDTFGRSLGVKLGGADLAIGTRPGGYSIGGSNRVGFGGSLNAVASTTTQISGNPALVDTNFVNMPASSVLGATPATFALSLFSASAQRFLNLEISALEADGKGKVVSSPRVITADQVKASIKQGVKTPYQRSTSSGATAQGFEEAALKLEVTPQITPEGNVILEVQINKDSLGILTPAGREINIKEVKTQVLVDNGGTVVIGGIFEQEETNGTSKVPFLGDLPYLGNLFKSNTRETKRTELLIFLTPKVINERTVAR